MNADTDTLILLVEDERVYADMMKRGLERIAPGFRITIAVSLALALDQLATGRFDAILLDLGLPDGEGLDTLRAVVAARGETPIIVLTGEGDESLGDEAMRAGAQDYLIKGESDVRQTARALRYAISRYAADLAMRASEKNYRDLFDNAPLGIFQSVPDGRFTYVNKFMATLLGYDSPQEMILSVTDIATQIYEIPERRRIEYAKMIKTGGPHKFETVLKRRDGGQINAWLIFRPLFGPDGALARVDGFVEDITRRKQAEEAQLVRLRYEKALSACSTTLLTGVTGEGSVNGALRLLREAAGADRIYIFENSGPGPEVQEAKLTHEECAPGIAPLIDDPQRNCLLYANGLTRWREELSLGYPIVGPADIFPDEEKRRALSSQAASVLILPVQVQGQWFGFIGFDAATAKRAWSQSDIFLLQTGGEIIGAYIERWRVEDRLRIAEKKYRNIFEQASEGIFQSSPQGRFLDANPAMAAILGYASPQELIADMNDIRSRLYATPADRDSLMRMLGLHGSARGFQARMNRRDGVCIWVEVSALAVKDAEGHISHIEGVLSDITERKLREAELDKRATQDALTGVPNRNLLEDRLGMTLANAKRYKRIFALLFIDLDKFKSVNDTMGHSCGDIVLCETAKRIQTHLRQSDTVARLGGDEFCAIVDNLKDSSDACRIAENVVEAISRPIQAGENQTVHIGASVGISFFPCDGETAEALMNTADAAMYRVKKRGGGGVASSTEETGCRAVLDPEGCPR